MGFVERFVHATFGQRVFVLLCLGALVVTALAVSSSAFAQPSSGYRLPPAPIPQILEAAPTPTAVLSPSVSTSETPHPQTPDEVFSGSAGKKLLYSRK